MKYDVAGMTAMFDLVPPTEKQRYIIQRKKEGATNDQISDEIGVTIRNVARQVAEYSRKLHRAGHSPRHDEIGLAPPGYLIKGKSHMKRDMNGDPVWIKTDIDKQAQLEAILHAIDNACTGIKPIKAIPAPKKAPAKDLATMYHFTDYHLAMYAWAAECGDDWDTAIAKSVFATALKEMMDATPDAELGIFSNGGDFCHWDGWDQVTPMSKHLLDADTRFPLLAEMALEMHIHAIEELLKKHKKVVAVISEGNHDMASSVWIRKAMKFYFKKNPRVTIDDSEIPFYAMLWGKQMLAWHHGHTVKAQRLPEFFSSDPRFRDMWGKADCCWIHKGHYHSSEKHVLETGGAIVEQHPTLASRDAYAVRHGYMARRAANAITYDKNRGEIGRRTVVPVPPGSS